jgi:hypothetical protein
MLLACIRSYLKSVMCLKLKIYFLYHPANLYLCQQEWEDPWLTFEAKSNPPTKSLGNTALMCSYYWQA